MLTDPASFAPVGGNLRLQSVEQWDSHPFSAKDRRQVPAMESEGSGNGQAWLI